LKKKKKKKKKKKIKKKKKKKTNKEPSEESKINNRDVNLNIINNQVKHKKNNFNNFKFNEKFRIKGNIFLYTSTFNHKYLNKLIKNYIPTINVNKND